ncbi:MAG TPA: hypothetical protein VLF40_03955 [Candidatus Saccharimonadales bacterium]|nr:hypothetical protein [Candidatus Saccharimonadales bacterium]
MRLPRGEEAKPVGQFEPMGSQPADVVALAAETATVAEPHASLLPHERPLQCVNRTPKPTEQEPDLGTVNLREAATAIRNGETLSFEISCGADGSIRYDVSPAFVPHNATLAETTDELPSAQMNLWSRLKRQLWYDSREPGEKTGTQDGQLDIQRLRQAAGTGWTLSTSVTGLSKEDVGATIRGLSREAEGFRITPGYEDVAAALVTRRQDLWRQANQGLVEESVVVGAADSGTLRRAEAAALAALPADGSRTSWEVVAGPDGQPQEFTSRQDAHAARSQGDRRVMGLEDVVNQLTVFDREHGVPGFDQKTPYNFALDYEKPTDPTIAFTHLLDNLDNPDGSPRQLGPLECSLSALTRGTAYVGPPGSGKTGALEEMAAQAAALGIPVFVMEAGQPAQEWRDINDYDNSWGQSLANRVAALTGDPARATVRVITPGKDEYRVTLDPLQRAGNNSWVRQAEEATIAITSSTLDEEAHRVYEKWLLKGLLKALEAEGVNTATDEPRYPFGEPAPPTQPSVAAGIKEEIADTGYESKERRAIEGYSVSQYENDFQGTAETLYRHGSTASYAKMLGVGGITVWRLGMLAKQSSRDQGAATFLGGLAAHLRDIAPVDGEDCPLRALVIVDEATIFGNNPTGAQNAKHIKETFRKIGLGVVIGTQDLIDLHPTVIANVGQVFASRVSDIETRNKIIERGGRLDFDAAEAVGELETGCWAYTGPGARMLRVASPNPATRPSKRGTLERDGRAIADLGIYDRFYTVTERQRAADSLLNTEAGRKILWWAIDATLSDADRHPMPTIVGPMRQLLDEDYLASQRLTPAIRDVMAQDAADMLATGPIEFGNAIRPSDIRARVAANMLAQMRRQTAPQRNLLEAKDSYLNSGHYSPVRDEVIAAMIAPAPTVKELARYQTLGSFPGRTARDVRQNVEKEARRVLSRVVGAVLAAPDAKSIGADHPAVLDFARLADSEDTTKAVRGHLAEVLAAKRPTSPEFNRDETDVLFRIIDLSVPLRQSGVSYAALLQKLDAAIGARQNQRGINMREWNKFYGTKFEGKTLAEQLASIDRHTAEHIRRTGYEISPVTKAFPRNRWSAAGQSVTDDIVTSIKRPADTPKEELDLERAHNNGRLRSWRLADLIFAGREADRADWNRIVSDGLIFNYGLSRTPGAQDFIFTLFGKATERLKERNQAYKATAGAERS